MLQIRLAVTGWKLILQKITFETFVIGKNFMKCLKYNVLASFLGKSVKEAQKTRPSVKQS